MLPQLGLRDLTPQAKAFLREMDTDKNGEARAKGRATLEDPSVVHEFARTGLQPANRVLILALREAYY